MDSRQLLENRRPRRWSRPSCWRRGRRLLAGTGSSSAGVALGCVAVLCAVVAVNRFTGLTGEVVPVWERVRREIERARRHNGSLVLVRLPLSPATGSVRAVAEQVEFLLRATDYVWVEDRVGAAAARRCRA